MITTVNVMVDLLLLPVQECSQQKFSRQLCYECRIHHSFSFSLTQDFVATTVLDSFESMMTHACFEWFWMMTQLELLAAKNLIAANLNGTSDPYAVITCGAQKRFR
jgi:hypothetical protein